MDRPPGGSREGVNLGGSSGSTDNPTSKKIPFFTNRRRWVYNFVGPDDNEALISCFFALKFVSQIEGTFGAVLFCNMCLSQKSLQKQGLVQDYTQRLIEGNIYRQKLSRLKLSRLRPHRLRLSRLRTLGVRLSRLQLYGSETGGGGGGGSNEIIYSSISRKKY